LQGVKRGIMEMADLVLVNKADGDLKPAATRTVADYAGALRLLRKRPQDPEGFPRAMPVSAVTGAGLDAAWEAMRTLADRRRESGWWDRTRGRQAAHWFEEEVRAGLLAPLARPEVRAEMERRARAVAEGRVTVAAAAEEMVARLRSGGEGGDGSEPGDGGRHEG
jgi:LAO/AO transport system kinase